MFYMGGGLPALHHHRLGPLPKWHQIGKSGSGRHGAGVGSLFVFFPLAALTVDG